MVVRDGDRILAHGSTGSRWMRRLASGVPTSLGVTATWTPEATYGGTFPIPTRRNIEAANVSS
jgi:hypothetical protein